MVSADRLFSVYMIENMINKKVYVGATRQPPKVRWRGKERSYSHNKYFHDEIIKYGWENFKKAVIAEELTKESAQELERKLIADYDSTNAEKGYNHMAGGEGLCGYFHKPAKVKPMLGKKHTEEAKRLMSIARKGTKQSAEWIEKRFKNTRGVKLVGKRLEYVRELCRKNQEAKKKPVIAINAVTGFLTEFNSLAECRDYTGCTCISDAIKNGFTRRGYKYCYVEVD